MDKIQKTVKDNSLEEDFGFLLWQLEGMENFYPIYKTMIKKE